MTAYPRRRLRTAAAAVLDCEEGRGLVRDESGDEGSGGMVPGFTPRRVMIVAAMFIVGYFGVSAVSNAVTHVRLVSQQESVQQEIDALRQRQARLQALKAYMESDAFIEAQARENGLVKPGEVAVVRVGGGATLPAVRPGEPWWMRYFPDATSDPRR